MIKKLSLPDGSTIDHFVNGTAIVISVNELDNLEYLESFDNQTKQYRTENLVDTRRYKTIDVFGHIGDFGNLGLTPKMQTALKKAVANYNNLNSSITMNLRFGKDSFSNPISDIIVSKTNLYGSGGLAGFPSRNGDPYKWVQIGQDADNFSTGYNTLVLTHELGHCLGLRHTDYFARVCNGVNEGETFDGAIHIPSTPTGIDITSIMISCLVPGTDPNSYTGDFNNNDKKALEYMYLL